jgi:AcrR family transcriptional regulator
MTDSVTPKKSDLARARILTAARRIFASEGYERATIRAIAAEATINPSLVIRYFGSKEGLFAAIASLDFKADALASAAPESLGEALVAHVLDLWEDERDGSALAAMMRASISNEGARERVVAQFTAQMAQVFSIIGDGAFAAAPFIATQILGLTMARYVWRIPAIVTLPKAAIVERVGRTVQRYLDETKSL